MTMIDDHLRTAQVSCQPHPGTRGQPIYSWLGPSSFSPMPQDMWARGAQMPFQIVLLPGYKTPQGLNQQDIDALWYEPVVKAPLAVWDGVSSWALHEIIAQCFDPKAELDDFIKVRRVSDGRLFDDARPASVRLQRPTYDMSGPIDCRARARRRKEFYQSKLRPWINKTARNLLGYDYMGDLVSVYEAGSVDDRWQFQSWKRTLKIHPDSSEKSLFGRGGKRQVVSGMHFGVADYEAAVKAKPEWHDRAMQIEELINEKSPMVQTAYQIAWLKVDGGVPLTPAEQAVYDQGGDRRSQGEKFFDKGLAKRLSWFDQD